MSTAKAQDTSNKILTASAKLFDKFGYYNVSIKQIAQAAKINSALISYHFGSKKELYLAVLAKEINIREKLEKQIAALDTSPLIKLQEYLGSILALQLNSKRHFKLIYQELLTPTGLSGDWVTKGLDAIHQYTISLLEEAITSGYLKPELNAGHAAFTLESITVLAFLSRKQLRLLYPGDKEKSEKEITMELVSTYLAPFKTAKED